MLVGEKAFVRDKASLIFHLQRDVLYIVLLLL